MPGNAAAIAMVLDVAQGTALTIPTIRLSNAVAIQVCLLFHTAALKHLSFSYVYRALAAFALGMQPSSTPKSSVERLRMALSMKPGNGVRNAVGLVEAFRHGVKYRERDPSMAGFDAEAATTHLLVQYDRELFAFDFDNVRPQSGASGSGGGGGDPGGEPSVPDQLASGRPPPAQMDIRTRTFATAVAMKGKAERRKLAQQGAMLSVWHCHGGELRDDALRIIDALVRVVPLPRARRAETHELQAIALRKQVDAMRRQLASAEGEARASAREATRAIRARDAALEREASRAQAAVAAAEAARAQYVTELRDFRDAAAAKHRAFRREFIEERAANLDRMKRMDEETVAMGRELAKVRADRRLQLSVKDGQVAKLQAEARARPGGPCVGASAGGGGTV